MSNVSQLPSTAERRERRRLHLRDVSEPEASPLQATVGATLRAARIARALDPDNVAAALKMRREQLDAIEDDDFSKLPGRAYAVGFVRAYASHVGLDLEAVLKQFKDQTAEQDQAKASDLVFPEAHEERQWPHGSILILALVIAIIIYGLSYLTMPNRKRPTTASAADAPVVVVEEDVTVEEPTPASAPQAPAVTVDDAVHSEPSETPSPTFVAGAVELPDVAVATPAALSQSPHAQLSAPPMPDLAAFVLAQNDESASPAASGQGRVVLKALEPTYIRIRDMRTPGSKVVVERVLSAGESYRAPERPGLLMQTGNAGGLQVEVDGRAVGVLGKRGEVVTRIPVDASYFLERLAASQ